MKKVITYNLADNFIAKFADYLQENYLKKSTDLSRLLVVFGGRRPSLFLQKELSEKIKGCFFPPKFLSIDEFIEYALTKKDYPAKISDLDACFMIYNLAKKFAKPVLEGREQFSQFLPWAKEILTFIDYLDLEDIKTESLKNVQSNADIGYDVPRSINNLLSHIVSLREAFHAELREKKLYSRGFLYLSAMRMINPVRDKVSQVSDGCLRQFVSNGVKDASFNEFDKVFFCNFFYLHKTEEIIFKYFYESDKAVFFFQGSENDWPVLSKISKSLNCEIEPQGQAVVNPKLSLHSASGLHLQVAAVREILKTIKHPEKTVIVLPDPDSVIPLLCEIAAYVKDFNVSMGYPLKRSSVYSLFECLFKAQETKKDKAYYAKDYLRLMSHPLIKNLMISGEPSITRVLIHKIEEALIGAIDSSLGGSLFVKPDDILNEEKIYEAALETIKGMDISVSGDDLKVIVRQLHKVLFHIWEDVGNFYEFCSSLKEFLDILFKKSLLDKYPLNLKIADRVYELIEELQDSNFREEVFLKEDIFKIFKEKLETEMVSFSGSPLKGLQILGLLETRALNFENVIILDANEGVFPKLKVREPLIPRDVMISLGINRLENEEEIQRYQFRRLIASAKRVELFYQEREDRERSRFIEELIWERQKKAVSMDALPVSKAFFKIKVLSKDKGIEKKCQHIAFLKNYRYSASSVNTYLHCPLRFYYQYVLGLKEKEDVLDEPEASEIGNFVHSLLEEVFSRFIGRRPKLDAEFKDFFFAEFNKKFDNEFKRKMKSDAFLIKEVLELRLKQFLNNETERPVQELLCVEKAFEGKIEFKGQEFNFKSRIDRIDRLFDGSILILDYKTGSSDIMPADTDNLDSGQLNRGLIKDIVKSFQLPLYYYFVKETESDCEINAALYDFRNLNKGFGIKKLFKREEDSKQKDEIMASFMKALEFILFEILDKDVPFKADEENSYYCKYCPFFYLCR